MVDKELKSSAKQNYFYKLANIENFR